jgi:hypothetical protein
MAAAAKATKPTATHKLEARTANKIGRTPLVHTNIAAFRAAITDDPRRISAPESHPPLTLPTSDDR